MFRLQPVQPAKLIRSLQFRFGPLGKTQVTVQVPSADGGDFSRVLQFL